MEEENISAELVKKLTTASISFSPEQWVEHRRLLDTAALHIYALEKKILTLQISLAKLREWIG